MVQCMPFKEEKQDVRHFQSTMTLSCTFLLQQHWTMPFCMLTLHFWIMSAWTIHLLSKCEKQMLLAPSSATEDVQWPAAHICMSH